MIGMYHRIRKYNGDIEICCKFNKETNNSKVLSYGTIYFERDIGKDDTCRICGKRLNE